MTKRTRYFMLGSGAVLVAGLCAGLVAYYGGFPTTGAVAQTTTLNELRYVPQDAAVVAYANVREVMSSQFREHFKSMTTPRTGRGQDDFEQMTGISIDRDIDYVLACMSGTEAKHGGFVLARGRFDEARLRALANQRQAVTTEYRGKRLIRPTASEGAETQVIAFMEPGLLAVGDDATVRRAIDTREGSQNITTNAQLMSLMNDAQGSGNAWAVGRFDALRTRAQLPDQIGAQIPPIESFAVTGRFNGGLSGTFRAETMDAQGAENLRDVVRGMLALVRMQAGSKPEMQQLLQSLELGGSGTTVALSFVIPTELIETLGGTLHGHGQPEPER